MSCFVTSRPSMVTALALCVHPNQLNKKAGGLVLFYFIQRDLFEEWCHQNTERVHSTLSCSLLEACKGIACFTSLGSIKIYLET
jgi:hypothetical protein